MSAPHNSAEPQKPLDPMDPQNPRRFALWMEAAFTTPEKRARAAKLVTRNGNDGHFYHLANAKHLPTQSTVEGWPDKLKPAFDLTLPYGTTNMTLEQAFRQLVKSLAANPAAARGKKKRQIPPAQREIIKLLQTICGPQYRQAVMEATRTKSDALHQIISGEQKPPEKFFSRLSIGYSDRLKEIGELKKLLLPEAKANAAVAVSASRPSKTPSLQIHLRASGR